MPKKTKLLLILIACLAFNIYADGDSLEMIVVNKIPKEFNGSNWYMIGLSVNGKEPVEIIWQATNDPNSLTIIFSEIGDTGVISLDRWAIRGGEKLPKPNAENPPIIGSLGEVIWQPLRFTH